MDGIVQLGIHLSLIIDRVSKHIENTPQRGLLPPEQGSGCQSPWQACLSVDHPWHPLPRYAPSYRQYDFVLPESSAPCRDAALQSLQKDREYPPGEFHIHHTTKNLYNTACCVCHDFSSSYLAASASAPPTISKISFVIACWRTLLYASCNAPTSSLALSVALRMATMRAACSLACDSKIAW